MKEAVAGPVQIEVLARRTTVGDLDLGAVGLLSDDVRVCLGEAKAGGPQIDNRQDREGVRQGAGARYRRLADRSKGCARRGTVAKWDVRRAKQSAADSYQSAAGGLCEEFTGGIARVIDRTVEITGDRDRGKPPLEMIAWLPSNVKFLVTGAPVVLPFTARTAKV